GIGSRVRLFSAGRLGDSVALLGHQEVTTGYGYASGQEALCHFGLNDVGKVDLEVVLPNGQTLSRRAVEANQRVVVEE
ncbi:MAG TPA: ASPIC/UnbV domain-containing protein, partial [Planctomycetaceae bacterium]|nr:ASPIC/UnbV domain-containing protein [Planctomycetaceae bacterium]